MTNTLPIILLIVAAAGCGARTAASDAVQADVALSWMAIPTDSGAVRVAVARPGGAGPFPAVLILHGSHGFAAEYVELARDLAERGVLSFAACWFDGGTGEGRKFITPIACNGGPPFINAPGADRFQVSRRTLDAVTRTLRASPDVRSLAAFGHSRGGGAALDFAIANPQRLSALILNSTGYPDGVITRAATLSLPVLLLHGEADHPADGGSAMSAVARARNFEQSLKQGGVAIESKFYAGGHSAIFTDAGLYRDVVRRRRYR